MRERENNHHKIFSLIPILAICIFLIGHTHNLEINYDTKNYSSDSNNLTFFDSAGTEKITISGEPIYLGDNFQASILVSNQGNNSGNIILYIQNNYSSELIQSQSEYISSGSSIEIFVIATATNIGLNYFNWWIFSDDGIVNDSLSGQFEINVLGPQTFDISIDSFEWSISDGLELEYSTFLSQGKNRDVIFEIIGFNENRKFILQSIHLELDPGIRKMSINLGNPEVEYIEFNLVPNGWLSNPNSSNNSAVELIIPYISPVSSIDKITPSNPVKGTSAIVDFSLNNNGNTQSPNSMIRILHSSTNQILSELSVPSISPGDTYTNSVEIVDWPDEKIVDFRLIWTINTVFNSESSESVMSVESMIEEEEFQFPVDINSLAIGIIAGISLVLASRLVWGTISERTPYTSETGLRETRVSRKKKEEETKIEIKCPFCSQSLRVPASHMGQIKCPSCTKQFNTKDLQDVSVEIDNNSSSELLTSHSDEDLLDCPKCNQKLRVPIDKRPVTSRCPVCKTEFLAKIGRD